MRLNNTVEKLKQPQQSEALKSFHRTPIAMQSPWRQRAGLPWTSSVWSISAEVPKGNLSLHQPSRHAPRGQPPAVKWCHSGPAPSRSERHTPRCRRCAGLTGERYSEATWTEARHLFIPTNVDRRSQTPRRSHVPPVAWADAIPIIATSSLNAVRQRFLTERLDAVVGFRA